MRRDRRGKAHYCSMRSECQHEPPQQYEANFSIVDVVRLTSVGVRDGLDCARRQTLENVREWFGLAAKPTTLHQRRTRLFVARRHKLVRLKSSWSGKMMKALVMSSTKTSQW